MVYTDNIFDEALQCKTMPMSFKFRLNAFSQLKHLFDYSHENKTLMKWMYFRSMVFVLQTYNELFIIMFLLFSMLAMFKQHNHVSYFFHVMDI